MKKKLKILQILFYYDLPELFTARDEVETIFLCSLVDAKSDTLTFLASPISPLRLAKFKAGQLDLYEILTQPEINEWYIFNEINDEDIIANKYDVISLPINFLPEKGFFLNTTIEGEEGIMKEVAQIQNAVVHLALTDYSGNGSIEALHLGEVVTLYQLIIENTYKKSISQRKTKDKSANRSNYTLRAFASSTSSFNIHLYSTSQTDLFGSSEIEIALEKFDQITNTSATDDEFISTLQTIKGHAISSYKKLIQKIISSNLKIKHKWYSPSQKQVHSTFIDKFKAERIIDVLNLSDELTKELREFTGVFVEVDVERGNWRLVNNEDSKEYNGEAERNMLEGITVATVTYRLVCEEIIEEFKVTEKEKTRYVLKNIYKLD